jgi:hypothetical protein
LRCPAQYESAAEFGPKHTALRQAAKPAGAAGEKEDNMAQEKASANVKAEGKKKRIRFHEYTAENDMKYRGPLNYQSFQLFGWLCIVLSAVAAIIDIGGSISPSVTEQFGLIGEILRWISYLSLPFLLMANFSKILANQEGYKKQLLRNGGAAFAIFFVTIVLGSRYFVGTVEQMVTPREEVVPLLETIINGIKPEGFLAFNLFIDLFMCTLTMYFLNARPKRVFTGKKLIIFRLFTLLPIAYEVVCFVLKVQTARGRMVLPLWSFPLLTMKPPMTFAFFVFIAFLVKFREYRYCKHGKTHEEYLAFMKTNRNSFQMSVHLCFSMIAFALIDVLLFILLIYGHAASVLPADATAFAGETLTEAETLALGSGTMVAEAVGIGGSMVLAAVAPLMLLYSYNAEPKNKKISLVIPAVGVFLIILIVLEAIRLGVGMIVGDKKIDLQAIRQSMQQLLEQK